LLGGLRRCEVLGLRGEDVNTGERRLFVAEGKGGRQRVVPVSGRFFASLGDYLEHERPPEATTKQLFVVLKGPRRGAPLAATGLAPGWRRRPAISCATPVSPVCGRLAWRWRRSRPRPATRRSSRPASTCTWRMTGWRRSTCESRRRSRPKPSRPAWRRRDE